MPYLPSFRATNNAFHQADSLNRIDVILRHNQLILEYLDIIVSFFDIDLESAPLFIAQFRSLTLSQNRLIQGRLNRQNAMLNGTVANAKVKMMGYVDFQCTSSAKTLLGKPNANILILGILLAISTVDWDDEEYCTIWGG